MIISKWANSLEKTLMLQRWRAGGEEGDRWWDGWMASPTQWIWIGANSGRQWRIGKPGVVQSMGSQRVGHDLATEQEEGITVTIIESDKLKLSPISRDLDWSIYR